jgi:hypothetical protein
LAKTSNKKNSMQEKKKVDGFGRETRACGNGDD